MDVIENAIRSAFDKGDPADPAFRERVYRSAFAAMERAIAGNPNMTPEQAEQRRQAVRDQIDQIESEFVPAVDIGASPAPAPDTVPAVEPDRPDPTAPAPEIRAVETRPAPPAPAEPVILAERRERTAPSPASEPALVGPGERVVQAPRSGGFLGRVLPALVAVLVVGAGVWWAVSNGLFTAPEPAAGGNTAETGGPSDEVADVIEQAEAPDLSDEGSAPRDWITVFTPDDPALASAPAGASAEVMEEDGQSFLRIRSGEGSAPVTFDVGQGVLEQLAGGRAVFDIVARAEEGQLTQISVSCDFGALGECGRKRYLVNYERAEYLFDMQLPDQRPAGGGTIAIVSDVENAGKAIDVFEIRAAVTD